MPFNKGRFNHIPFNRLVTEERDPDRLRGTITQEWGGEISAGGILRVTPISGAIYWTGETRGNLGAVNPLPATEIQHTWGGRTLQPRVRYPLAGDITQEWGGTGQVLTVHAYSLSLDGLNLAPGQTVIIDTDTLDIYVNGQYNVQVWQGGEFFQLAPGDNVLQVYTDGGAGQVTVEWEDRWY